MRTAGSRATGVALGIAAVWTFASLGLAQQSDAKRREFIQRKLAAVEQFAAANQAALRKYTWTETVRFLLKSELRSTWKFACRYGPEGQVERTPIGPPPPASTAGPFRPGEREETREDLEATAEKVRATVRLYVPPDPRKMEQAFEAGNVRVDRPGQGEAVLQFKSYAKPGDSMVLDFRTETRKLASLKVVSYFDDPSRAVTLDVRFAALPDGTNYPENVDVSEQQKAMQVMITSSNYRLAP